MTLKPVANSKNDSDVIRSKLLSTKEWRIKTGCLKRIEYENLRKENGRAKIAHTDLNILPFGTNEELDRITKPKHNPSTGGRQTGRQTMTRFSRVFKKSMVSSKNKITAEPTKEVISTKEQKVQLQELVYDKIYFNRVLWDEHVRMLYLRGGKLSQTILKQKPYLRLWMEALMHGVAEKSRTLRKALKTEIRFLNSRYQVQRQLHFWQTLHSLTLDQLYHKKCQNAFRKKIRHDTLIEELDSVWRWFNLGLYCKVARLTKPLITTVNNWVEKSVTSLKYKILSDLYYARGLSLMHLKKYNSAFRCFKKDGDIGDHSHLKISVDRSKDNIGRIHAIKGNYRQAIKLWSERLLEVSNCKEKAWLCYGIAQCFALEENYEKAIEMCNRCISNADQVKSYCWELNGNLLLANCSAVLGTIREMNVRTNTIISLKAINRAYQCAVFLANVSVIRKIVEIVVHIYNSFKDIDLTMLEDVWSSSLMDYARKATVAEAEKVTETRNMNISNAMNAPNISQDHTKKQRRPRKNSIVKNEIRNNDNDNYGKKTLKDVQCKIISKTIVNVCVDDIELHSICSPRAPNKSQRSVSFIASPITAVEVISSNDEKVDEFDDDWVTESENEDA